MIAPSPSPAPSIAIPALAPRADFPLLAGDPGLVYLDSAASAQKPAVVLDRMADFYIRDYANIHRGLYPLSERSSAAYEAARERVAAFLNADREEIVFTRNATEAINLVAQTYGETFLKPGDLILASELEHHANIVPWYQLAKKRDLRFRPIPIDDAGDLDCEAFAALLRREPKIVAITALANTIGTAPPLAEIVAAAKAAGAVTVIDAAQAAPHLPLDVAAIGCDFLALTGHKLYGPDGIGALYGKGDLLAAMPPWQGGGGMIRSVAFDHIEFAAPPRRFEAGTPFIAGAIGWAAALDFLAAIGFPRLLAHDAALLAYAEEKLGAIPGLKIIGRPRRRVGLLSFAMKDWHPHDVASLLGEAGIALRAGHHCAAPLMARFGLAGTLRLSLALHSTSADIDRLAEELIALRRVLP